jgi:DUF1009 family protein
MNTMPSEMLTENATAMPADTRLDPNTAIVGLVAGEGELPVMMLETMLSQGLTVFVYAMDPGNVSAFRKRLPANRVHPTKPGLLNKNFRLMHEHGLTHAVFGGKVNKWVLLRHPVLDARAMALFRQSRQLNDDNVMLMIIREFEEQEGILVLPQTHYLTSALIPPGQYSQRPPSDKEADDIKFALTTAREMGRLDIGQTVIVHNGMVIAVEAIEGTDQAIRRSGKWTGKKGGVVAKVEKPGQDQRFDVPTVGPRTLVSMRKAGLKVLAVEAHKTLVLDLPKMTRLADQWHMTFLAL